MQNQRQPGILEHAAIAGIEIALRGHTIREQNVVRIELNMEIVHRTRVRLADDAAAVQ